MLARPEIGTREHILLWLAARQADEIYRWQDASDCVCGRYCHENYHDWQFWIANYSNRDYVFRELSNASQGMRTMGAVYEKMRRIWG